jgi:starvation-inducible DNA-binding protein
MFPTQHYLSQDIREAVVEMLNQCLADTTDLMTQAKAAHWNVKGIEFFQLHELFDEIAEVLEEQADLIAERATALGGQATGTARQAASRSRIPELPQNVVAGPQLVEELANHLAIHDANLHEQINRATEYGDLDTADLLNEVSREISKQLYFLESHLQVESPRGVQWGQQVAIGQGGASQLGFGQQTQGGAGQQYQGVVGQQSR